MSARTTILRELNARHQRGDAGYLRPASISGFNEQPSRYQEAVNKLLQERLINGTKDDEGRLAIGINAHQLPAVQKELRPPYARAGVWLAGMVVILAVAVAARFLL
jgi:hypothetical protein